ncbi:MAG: LysR substrate-binding domain-containing protein [Bradyrhizobium sp.]
METPRRCVAGSVVGQFEHGTTISRREAPKFCSCVALEKWEGAGNAGRWPHPWPASRKECWRQEPQVQPRHPGIPRAMVYGLYVLSPGTGLVCPRHRRIITTSLASASGGQDHTISPSAPCRSSAGESPLQHSPSIAFRCNVRDDRDTSPPEQRNGRDHTPDFGRSQYIFCFSENIDGVVRTRVICPDEPGRTEPALLARSIFSQERPTLVVMRRLPLKNIEAFVAVARAGSLAQAAVRLNLTVPALSRRIQLLEAELGVRMFERQPRGVALTERGRDYFAALDPAWESMTRATEAARTRGRRNAITVTVMPTFAANWLISRLQQFHVQHKAVEIALETSAEIEDLNAKPRIDCAIRLGFGPWPGLVCEPLLAVDAVPVASPRHLATAGERFEPETLLHHKLIGTSHQMEFWQEWLAGVGIDATPHDCLAFDNLQVVYEAAAAGMGIALGLAPVVRPFIESGRLIPVCADTVRLRRQFHLVHRGKAANPAPGFARFRDWLFAEAAACAGHPAA